MADADDDTLDIDPSAPAAAPQQPGPPAMTISEFIAHHGVTHGGVSLSDSDAESSDGVSVSLLDQTHAGRLLAAGGDARYTIGRELGKGGMGLVLSAKDQNIRRHVAMKILTNDEAEATTLLRFVEEAQITGQLEHPGIVPIYELGVNGEGKLYYTMKLVKGVTLGEIISRLRAGDRAYVRDYPLSHLLRIYLRVLEAMMYAHHKHVVHRDLKPANIMVGEFGEVLILDWGLAKVAITHQDTRTDDGTTVPGGVESVRHEAEDVDLTGVGQILGTPRYMAPEQTHTQRVDTRADIYSLGSILYEILTLRHALDGNSVTDLLMKLVRGEVTPPADRRLAPADLPHCPDSRVPLALSAVCMRAMAVQPDARYQTVDELRAEIQNYLDGYATRAEGASRSRHAWLFLMRHKTETVLLAVAAVVLVSVVSVFFVRLHEQKEIAVANAVEANVQREQAQYRAYVAGIGLAQQQVDAGDLAAAAATLASCPPDLRRWEWGYLQQRLATVQAHISQAHSQGMGGVAISLDSQWLVTVGEFETSASIWQLRPERTLARRITTAEVIVDAALSPSGRTLALLDQAGAVHIHDVAGGERLRTVAGDTDGTYFPGRLVYSPAGDALAVHTHTANSRELWLVDPIGGRRLQHLASLPKVWESALVFSADGRQLASSAGTEVIVWELRGTEFRKRATLKGHREFVFSLAFSPNGRQLISGARDSTVKVWDLDEREPTAVTLAGHRQAVTAVAFGRDAGRVVSAGSDGLVIVWDLHEGRQLARLQGAAVNAMAVSDETGRLYLGYADGSIGTWDLQPLVEQQVFTRYWRYTGFTWDQFAVYSPDGTHLLMGDASTDNATLLVDPRDGSGGDWRHGSAALTAAAFSPRGDLLAVAQPGGAILRATVATGDFRDLAQHGSDVAAIDWSVAARLVSTGPAGLRAWNALDGSLIWSRPEAGHSLAATADGSRLLVGVASGAFWLDAATGEPVGAPIRAPASLGTVEVACLSRDGSTVVLAGQKIAIMDAETGNVRALFPEQPSIIKACAISPDGSRVATGGRQQGIAIWDISTGVRILTLDAPRHYVSHLAFSPDGTRLLSADQSGSFFLYASGE